MHGPAARPRHSSALRASAWIALIAASLLVDCSVSAHAQESVPRPEDLLTASSQEQPEVVRRMIAQRVAQIAGLLELMDEEEDWARNWGAARNATFMLGYLRAVEAAPALARFVDSGHRFPYAVLGRGPAWQGNRFQMAAVWALVNIGEPCLDGVVDRIAEGGAGETGQASSYCVRVLVELRGVEGAGSLLIAATAAENDQERRMRLSAALSELLKHGADCARVREDQVSRGDPFAHVP
ncbi:MAG TPA: hypothetical protein DEP45_13285 [Armatimonadetes bacterium]|nr:hypothetical protein [Armatimonadota bacterium]